MKILHISQSDTIGGAARAAYRIHRMIVNKGFKDDIFSEMRVVKKIVRIKVFIQIFLVKVLF